MVYRFKKVPDYLSRQPRRLLNLEKTHVFPSPPESRFGLIWLKESFLIPNHHCVQSMNQPLPCQGILQS